MEYWMMLERGAAKKVSDALKKPTALEYEAREFANGNRSLDSSEAFDPWEDVVSFCHGSYCGDFDKCAIETLTDIRDGTIERRDLASRMFREHLCTLHLCDYGSSPRACFPTTDFKPLMNDLIDKWRQYSLEAWGMDVTTVEGEDA